MTTQAAQTPALTLAMMKPVYYCVSYTEGDADEETSAYTEHPTVALELLTRIMARDDVSGVMMMSHPIYPPNNAVNLDLPEEGRPTPANPFTIGRFTFDGTRVGGPAAYMKARGSARMRRHETRAGRDGAPAYKALLADLNRDFLDCTDYYTPENLLTVGEFDYDGARVGGPAAYMTARGHALLEAKSADRESFSVTMREVLALLDADLSDCKARLAHAIRTETPLPDDTRFLFDDDSSAGETEE